jgi:hypothetical protein
MKTDNTKLDAITSTLRSICGISAYECKSCDPKYNAQRNLEGRSHYADSGTLKFFKSRILSAHDAASGLLFCLIESTPGISDNPKKTKRAVVFDVFGTVVNERASSSGGTWYATSEQAHKDAMAFIASFDAIGHTIEALKARAKRLDQESKDILSSIPA